MVKDYTFEIHWDSSKPFNPHQEAVDVRVIKGNVEYSSNFVTIPYLNYVFEKNKKTGECANGSFFSMPGMVVVRDISEECVKRTIDALFENCEFDQYFKELNE